MNNALAFNNSAEGLSPEQWQSPSFQMTSAKNPLCAELVTLRICVWRGIARLDFESGVVLQSRTLANRISLVHSY